MDPKTLPPHTVRAHLLPGVNIELSDFIRPAQIKRGWMDAMPQSYAYRCIPLLAANTMGWELLNPTTSTACWDGGDLTSAITIQNEQPGRFAAASHFGTGIVTWYLPFVFRTSPDLGLYVTGPGNHDHNDAAPLDAFIRTDWLPFPFTLNWRMLKPNTDVIFEAGTPLARIMPFPLAMIDETKLEIDLLNNDPGFAREMAEFGKARQANIAKQQNDAARAKETGEALTGDGVWNAQYVKAKGEDQGSAVPHQTIFRPGDIIDLTDE